MTKSGFSSAVGKDTKKVAAITFLFATTILIMISGIILCVLSFVNNLSFQVMGSPIHGAVFGGIVVFLGLRYFLSVGKLRAEVYKTTSRFSWSNFRNLKSKKII